MTHFYATLSCESSDLLSLFGLNPHLTPADLLKVMDGCMEAFSKQPTIKHFKRGVRWHARNGYKLETFASYLRGIEKQLGVASGVKLYLNEQNAAFAEESKCEQAKPTDEVLCGADNDGTATCDPNKWFADKFPEQVVQYAQHFLRAHGRVTTN
jgi:hypothetical protein